MAEDHPDVLSRAREDREVCDVLGHQDATISSDHYQKLIVLEPAEALRFRDRHGIDTPLAAHVRN